MTERILKSADESRTEQTYEVMQPNINGYGRLFGGQLMQWIDGVAGIVSRRHSGMTTTTATVDMLNFKAPVYVNSVVVLTGQVTYVGHTSMEVRVDTYVEDLDGKRTSVNNAYLVMVAIDDNGKPLEVPGIKIETPEQQAEWDAGERRYQLRKQRRVEGF